MWVLTAGGQACPCCKMLPVIRFVMSLLGTVGGYSSHYLVLAFLFLSIPTTAKGGKDAVIAVDTLCLFEISYNVDSLEVKGPGQLTFDILIVN